MKRSGGHASKRRTSPLRGTPRRVQGGTATPEAGSGSAAMITVAESHPHGGLGVATTSPASPPVSAADVVLEPPAVPGPAASVTGAVEPAAAPPAFKRPEISPPAPSSRVEEFLGFRLDGEEYCIWIRSIKEIIRPSEITPIPRSPAAIVGLISLRGTIVPIFNIRRRLGLPPADMGPKSRIVVVVLDAGPVGMVVDHVTEVIRLDSGALEPAPPTLGEREASLVTATVRLRDRVIGVLHLDRLVVIETDAPVRAVA